MRTGKTGGRSRNSNFRQNEQKKAKRKPMLNLGKLDYFNWDLNEIMDASDMDEEKVNTFKANMTAKARQRSIKEAKDFVREVEERGDFSRETGDRLCRLLDRYSRIR
ncbi:MAG: hypothetical protein JXA22_07110 [Candidatus Thermoplasmatota archaeon]|nr:hypothetical protein [Candidatus Thermoplasmatota archaeon]